MVTNTITVYRKTDSETDMGDGPASSSGWATQGIIFQWRVAQAACTHTTTAASAGRPSTLAPCPWRTSKSTVPLSPNLSSGRSMWTACPLHCAAAGPFVATGNINFVSSRVIDSPLRYHAPGMARTVHFVPVSCSAPPTLRTYSAATLARAGT